MMSRVRSMSKAKLVLSGAFIVFVLASIAILIAFQSDIGPYPDSDADIRFETQTEMPVAYPQDSFDRDADLVADRAISVSDFGNRLDTVDNRISSIEKSVSQIESELSNYRSIESDTSKRLSIELQNLKGRIDKLANTDRTLDQSLEQIKIVLQKMQTKQNQESQSELPVAGLKLLSVSIWDDGMVAIVSLGNRKTALSVGNFFAGLKVEDISVGEQSLTLYEPATNKIYTLYADAIVYKEARAQ